MCILAFGNFFCLLLPKASQIPPNNKRQKIVMWPIRRIRAILICYDTCYVFLNLYGATAHILHSKIPTASHQIKISQNVNKIK